MFSGFYRKLLNLLKFYLKLLNFYLKLYLELLKVYLKLKVFCTLLRKKNTICLLRQLFSNIFVPKLVYDFEK